MSSELWTPEPEEQPFIHEAIRGAPRAFALIELDRDDAEGALTGARPYAWGLEFPERAALVYPDGRCIGTFSSATGAADRYSRLAEIRLVRR